ncbi:MAG: hypothetical protein H6828_02360 [Planctomycetes bacterium]|nr:hypothetical protein [Planctomycetota bacterium]
MSGAETPRRRVLRRELDELCREAQGGLRRARRRRALVRGLEQAVPFLLVVPAAWLVLRLVIALSGSSLGSLSGWWAVPATLVVPLCTVAFAWLSGGLARVERKDALAALDHELGLADRLLTADEFLGVAAPTPFMEAALEDAAAVAPAARHAALRLAGERWSPGRREAWIAAASALLLVLATWIGERQRLEHERGAVASRGGNDVAVLDVREEEERTTPPAEPRAEERTAPPRGEAQSATERADARRDDAGELSDQTKESEGKTGEGRSSDAQGSSGASESRGMPSNQSQQSEAAEKKPQPPSAKKPKPPAELQPAEQKDAEENSGSTAGKGSSKGSNKNPAVSKWSSKDQVTTDDDQEIEDDETTEDEEEDQESRGGMQPNLRDRKPPVSRDLRIGFGNQPNPDANGRGGPSEAKKSRGTASLVLGVPIPDRVKGQPNPGKTKITQERIEPKPEAVETVDATARRPREERSGYLQERELTPWMRTLVREYFLTLRNRERER